MPHNMDDDDDDVVMDTSTSTARQPAADSTPSSASDSDSDSDAELLAHNEKQAAHMSALHLKRSARIANQDEKLPPIKGSVFKARETGATRASKQMESELKSMALERKNKLKEKHLLAELRDDLESDKDADGADDLAASLAASEQRAETLRLALHDKYHCPITLFSGLVKFPQQVDAHWTPPKACVHPAHDLLLAAAANADGCSMVVFASFVEGMCKQKFPPPSFVAEMLFYRVVFNPHADARGTFSREHEMRSLRTLIEHRTEEHPLPSMADVLKAYGARADAGNARPEALVEANAESLDKRVVDARGGGKASVGLDTAIRNLACAFDVWTAQVDSEMCLRSLFGEPKQPINAFSETAVYCLAILILCVQILLSPFGSRLKIPVARLLEAVLDRVADDEWSRFRQHAAKSVIAYTPRFGLHCELVTYLFPVRTARTRHLGLDIAFLSLCQWHAGPAENPQPVDVSDVWRDAMEDDANREGMSFTVTDVLECMQAMPELGKQTDVEWGYCIARILKQTIVDRDVLATRKEGEIAKLQGRVKKMKMCSHRLAFGIPRQNLSLTLDALLTSMTGFLGNSRSVKKELNPNLKDEPVQANILTMFGKKK